MIWFRLVMLQNVSWHTLAGSHIKLALKLVTHGQENCASFRQASTFCVDEQLYPSKMTSKNNHRNLLENLRKFIARMSLVLLKLVEAKY